MADHHNNHGHTDCNGTIDCVDSKCNENADDSKQEESKKKWGIPSQGSRFAKRFLALVGVVLSYLFFLGSALQTKYSSINLAEPMTRNDSSVANYNDWWTNASNSTAAARRVEDSNLYRTVHVNQQVIRNVTPAEETKAVGSVTLNLTTRANVSYSQSMPRTVVKTEENMNASVVERNNHPNIKSSQQLKSVVSTTRVTLNTSSNGTVGRVREKPAASVVPKQTTSVKQSDSRPGTNVTKGTTNKVEAKLPTDSMLLQQGKGGEKSDFRLHNLRLAYIGDSVTRYTYLNLVHYLKFGEWMRGDNERVLMVVEKRFGSWMSFYNYTNWLLQPHEQCDCYRADGGLSPRLQVARKELYENRYYHDFERNVHVTYIQKFGRDDAWGHWNGSHTHHQHAFDKQPRPISWSYDWADTIRHHLGKLDPKPDYLVMNSGLWDTGRLEEPEVQQSIVDALNDTGIVGIYKTTTSGLYHSAPSIFPHENAMCKLLPHCHNVSYTYQFNRRDYWDRKHFRYHVYNRMNMELLEMLGVAARIKSFK